MWYDGYERSRKRNQTSFIIPAWQKGDKVLHRPSGFYGELLCMETAGGELWKLRVESAPLGDAMARGRQYCMQVHACDLELRA